MHKDSMTVVTKDVVESGRKLAGHLISTTRHGTRRALRGCDQAWQAGANALAAPRAVIGTKLRDDLVSLEGQLTLIAAYLVSGAADRTEQAVNGIADSACITVSQFDRVFDLRVMQSLNRMGMPIAEVVRAMAHRMAGISQDLNAFVAEQQVVAADAVRTNGKAVSRARRPTVAKNGRRARKLA
jgi:hypothetical protein